MLDDGIIHKLKEDDATELFFKLEFFKTFTTKEKLELAGLNTYIVYFSKGEFVIREGGPNNCLYILLEGSISITKNMAPGMNLTTLKPGSVFGEIAFLVDPAPRITNAIANGKVSVLRIDKIILQHLNPQLQIKIRDQLLRILINKLDAMNKALIGFIRSV